MTLWTSTIPRLAVAALLTAHLHTMAALLLRTLDPPVPQLLCPSSPTLSAKNSELTMDASAAASITLAILPVTAQAQQESLTAHRPLPPPVAGPRLLQKTEWRGDGLCNRFATISNAACTAATVTPESQ